MQKYKMKNLIFISCLLFVQVVEAGNYKKDYCDNKESYTSTVYPHLHCDKQWITYSYNRSSHYNFLVGDKLEEGIANNACSRAPVNLKAKIKQICDDFNKTCNDCTAGEEDAYNVGDLIRIKNIANGQSLRHAGYMLWQSDINEDSTVLEKDDSSFYLREGLSDSSCYSFESKNYPSHFIRHQRSRLKISLFENDNFYFNDATFCLDKDYSIIPINYPEHRIAINAKNEVWLKRKISSSESSPTNNQIAYFDISTQDNCYGIEGTYSSGIPLKQNGTLLMTSKNSFIFKWDNDRIDAQGTVDADCQGTFDFPDHRPFTMEFDLKSKKIHFDGRDSGNFWQRRNLNDTKPASFSGQKDAYLGQGIYWPSGSLAGGRATKEILNIEGKPLQDEFVDLSRVVESESGFTELRENILDVSGSGYGQSASTSLRYTHSQQVNRTSLLYYIGRQISLHENYIAPSYINDIVLEDQALDYLINNGAKAFIDRYGTHLITSIKLGGTFNASHNVQSSSTEAKQTLAIDAHASISAWGVSGSATEKFNQDMSEYGKNTTKITDIKMTGASVQPSNGLLDIANAWQHQINLVSIESLVPQKMTAIPFASLTQVFGVMNGKRYEWVNGKWDKGTDIKKPADIALLSPNISDQVVNALYKEISELNFLVANVSRVLETRNYRRNWQADQIRQVGNEAEQALELIEKINYLNINDMTISEFNQKYVKSPTLSAQFNNLTDMNSLVIKWKVIVSPPQQPAGTFKGQAQLNIGDAHQVVATSGSGGVLAGIILSSKGIMGNVNWEHHKNAFAGPVSWNNIKITPQTEDHPTNESQYVYINNRYVELWAWAE